MNASDNPYRVAVGQLWQNKHIIQQIKVIEIRQELTGAYAMYEKQDGTNGLINLLRFNEYVQIT